MKKMMIALCAIASVVNTFANSFQEDYERKIEEAKIAYSQLTNQLTQIKSAEKTAKTDVEKTSVKAAKAKTKEAIEVNQEMTESLINDLDSVKTSHVGEFDGNNAYTVAMRRINRNQKLVLEGKSWFWPSKKEKAAINSNRILLENAIKNAQGDDKLDLIWEIHFEKYGK